MAMNKARMSREQTREQTRRQLLEAAARVIPEKGYQGASVEDITAAAGYSRGAFYSNFESKDALFLTLLRQVTEAEHTALDAIFAAGGTPADIRANIRHFYARLVHEQHHCMLWNEAKVHAAREPDFRQALNILDRETRDRITAFVERYCALTRQPPPAPARELATALLAVATGMAFAKLLDPATTNDDTVEAVLGMIFDALVPAQRET